MIACRVMEPEISRCLAEAGEGARAVEVVYLDQALHRVGGLDLVGLVVDHEELDLLAEHGRGLLVGHLHAVELELRMWLVVRGALGDDTDAVGMRVDEEQPDRQQRGADRPPDEELSHGLFPPRFRGRRRLGRLLRALGLRLRGAPRSLVVPDPHALNGLTPRQRIVLELIAQGYSTQDIARRLGRSVKTVETHRAQLMKRLNIHHVPGLVAFAIRAGVVAIA